MVFFLPLFPLRFSLPFHPTHPLILPRLTLQVVDHDAAYRSRAQALQIRSYFYGDPPSPPALKALAGSSAMSSTNGSGAEDLSPHSSVVKFEDLVIFRVGEGTFRPLSFTRLVFVVFARFSSPRLHRSLCFLPRFFCVRRVHCSFLCPPHRSLSNHLGNSARQGRSFPPSSRISSPQRLARSRAGTCLGSLINYLYWRG